MALDIVQKFTCEACGEIVDYPLASGVNLTWRLPDFPQVPRGGWRDLWGHMICPKHIVCMLVQPAEEGRSLDRLFMSKEDFIDFLLTLTEKRNERSERPLE